jgi:hypothetical protein
LLVVGKYESTTKRNPVFTKNFGKQEDDFRGINQTLCGEFSEHLSWASSQITYRIQSAMKNARSWKY